MRLRILALAVTLLFVATPFATAICDAMCAQRAGAHHEGRGHACCHDEQATGAVLRGATGAVLCGVPVADSVSAAWRFQDEGRSVLLPSIAVHGIAPISAASSAVRATPLPPTISPSPSQLRI
jgi:hypothetical protein